MPRTARSRAALEVTQPSAPSIASFTRVSKSNALPDPSAKKDAAVVVTAAPVPTPSRKRKASASFEGSTGEYDAGRLARRNVSFAPSDEEDEHQETQPQTQNRVKRSCRRPIAPSISQQPTTSRTEAPTTSSAQTAKGKRTAKVPASRKEAAHRPTASTVISKARAETKAGQAKIEAFYKKRQQTATENDEDSFPPHLADLVRLHKAFLKTVAIQLAHSRTNVPLDIRALSPDVSRSWGKRAVTIEDIRRCVALQSSTQKQGSQSPFIVSDYGKGKVCVELRPGYDGTSVNQPALCKQFAENLRALSSDRATNQMADASVDVALEGLSLAELPQVAVTDMNTTAKTGALFAKGQQALCSLKSGLAAKEQEKAAAKQQVQAPGATLLNPDGSKMSLLDRLRHKQLAAANAPLPPTGPELQRRAALSRAADVAATISMLSLSNPVSLPRQAFAMAVLAEKLRDSLRVPMSKEEGVACIKLIASEVAPEWLRIVAIGGRENVVIQRGGEPVNRVIQARVQKLLA